MSPTADPCGSRSLSRGDACLPLLVSGGKCSLLGPLKGVASAAPSPAATSELPPVNSPTGVQLIADAGSNYSALTALGMAAYGLTDVGEVLVAVNAINAAGPSYESYADTFLRGETASPSERSRRRTRSPRANRTASSPACASAVLCAWYECPGPRT